MLIAADIKLRTRKTMKEDYIDIDGIIGGSKREKLCFTSENC